MKVINSVLLDLDGKPITHPATSEAGSKQVPTTVGTVIVNCCLTTRAGKPYNKEQSKARYALAQFCWSAPIGAEIEIADDMIAEFIDLTCAMYGPMVSGQVIDILEPPTKQ